MKAIVLSGGGANGSYQIGVWKAIRKLKLKYDIVTGTSIGAFNGALMVQKDYVKALWLWKNLKYSFLFDGVDDKISKLDLYKLYIKSAFKDGGMDVTNLEKNVDKYIEINKFYNSSIDFGLVTYNLTLLKPITLVKNEIPKDKLKDYLMASATCFPAFKIKKIEGENFIDGGIHDILPINLAIDMGATEIIAVDLHTMGIKKKIKSTNAKIKYINPRNKLDSFLVFDKNIAKRGIRLGFNDMMKEFGKLDGDKYTFKYKNIDKNLNKYMYNYIKIMKEIFNIKSQSLFNDIIKITDYNQIIKDNSSVTKKVINNSLEYLCKLLEIDESYIYDIAKINKQIMKEVLKSDEISFALINEKIRKKDFKSILDIMLVVKYLYNKISKMGNEIKLKKEIASLAILFPKEFKAAIYVCVLKK